MVHIVYTISLPEEAKEIFEAFKKIARREGKTISGVLTEIIAEYVKAHSEGNPAFQLDKWVLNPQMLAMPTLGEDPTNGGLDQYSDQDLGLLLERVHKWRRMVEAAGRRRGWRV